MVACKIKSVATKYKDKIDISSRITIEVNRDDIRISSNPVFPYKDAFCRIL